MHPPARPPPRPPPIPPPPQVICLDNFFTGSKDNIAHLLDRDNFELIRHDVVEPILLEVRVKRVPHRRGAERQGRRAGGRRSAAAPLLQLHCCCWRGGGH